MCNGVSNHQPHDRLLNRSFRRRSKKTPKLRVTGLCAGNSPVTGEFPAQMTSDAQNVSIWWRHHEKSRYNGIMVPGWVDHYVCVWGIMGYTAEFTHGGGFSFEIKPQTFMRFRSAHDAAFTHGFNASCCCDIGILTDTFPFQEPAWHHPFWKYEYTVLQTIILWHTPIALYIKIISINLPYQTATSLLRYC